MLEKSSNTESACGFYSLLIQTSLTAGPIGAQTMINSVLYGFYKHK